MRRIYFFLDLWFTGGAADVVMMAMLNISNNKTLENLGWKMLLQIHDEVRKLHPTVFRFFLEQLSKSCF